VDLCVSAVLLPVPKMKEASDSTCVVWKTDKIVFNKIVKCIYSKAL
jgi:hypothetical protein